MAISVTHKSICDKEDCVNFEIEFDVYTVDGEDPRAFCGGCYRDISYTCVPISG